jgi:NitT/TauT family transport system ATP-binding protein
VTASVKVAGLRHAFGNLAVLDGLDFEVMPGEFVCVIGPSGCGKSTLLHVLGGLVRPSAGQVAVGGRALGAGDGDPRVGYVFQEPRLLNWRSARDNLRIALEASRVPPAEWEPAIQAALRRVGLLEFQHAWPLTLSGGMRQRLSIARALAIRPDYLLMDEPFSALDEMTARAMRRELLSLLEATPTTVLFITHSIGEAIFLADRILFLSRRPARIFKELTVPLPKPRDYGSPELYALEGEIVRETLTAWGYYDH